MIQKDDKVVCNSFQVNGITGVVVWVDEPNRFNNHLRPIQVELDKPYDESGHRMMRFSLKEVERYGI